VVEVGNVNHPFQPNQDNPDNPDNPPNKLPPGNHHLPDNLSSKLILGNHRLLNLPRVVHRDHHRRSRSKHVEDRHRLIIDLPIKIIHIIMMV
jgi:hypothetical protein